MGANLKYSLVAAALFCMSSIATAQETAVTDDMTDQDWMDWSPDASTIEMPALAFEESEKDTANYEKYYYFNRADTEFDVALADVRFCDELARGLATANYYPDPGTTAMYGIGGAIGGAIANAIYGSAEERRKRRANMRRCMNFKGYERYGLSKDLWQEFNFEEGNSSVPEEDRQKMLAQQAKVAAGPVPEAEILGL